MYELDLCARQLSPGTCAAANSRKLLQDLQAVSFVVAFGLSDKYGG